MPRVTKEPNISSKNGRAKLAKRREPYFKTIIRPGLGSGLWLRLGYRRTSGTWVAQIYNPGKAKNGRRVHRALGAADDSANGGGLSYAEAETAARAWLSSVETSNAAGVQAKNDYTVSDAMNDYTEKYKRNGGKAANRLRSVVEAHIKPSLGSVQTRKLTKRQVEDWLQKLAEDPPRVRPKRNATAPSFRAPDQSQEGARRRKSTANRILHNFKAAMNFAYQAGHVATDAAWRDVKPFREADTARVRYLSDEETRRLVTACQDEDFRNLVTAALLSGCRYGELAQMHSDDFNADSGTIQIRASKSGRPRHVVLTKEGQEFFSRQASRTKAITTLFPRGAREWRPSEQSRPMATACKAAKIEPAITFHELRHTYASRLIMAGAPLMVAAKQMGHSDTRMVEKHYGHLAPNYIADIVRSKFGDLGIGNE